MTLKKFTVTVECFDPAKATQGDQTAQTFQLPVDSSDAEHAVSAAMSNAVAFTTKLQDGTPLPIAFRCTGVSERT